MNLSNFNYEKYLFELFQIIKIFKSYLEIDLSYFLLFVIAGLLKARL